MRVSSTFEVDRGQLLRAVRETVRRDMSAAAGKEVAERAAAAGRIYKKRIPGRSGAMEKVTVSVLQLDEDGYRAEIGSRYGVNGVAYLFSPAGDGRTEVTYEETFAGANASAGISHTVLSKLSHFGDKRRMKAQLAGLERFAASLDRE